MQDWQKMPLNRPQAPLNLNAIWHHRQHVPSVDTHSDISNTQHTCSLTTAGSEWVSIFLMTHQHY